MAKLILSGSTSGSISIESPAVSGTTTLTLPTTSGTVITTGSTFGGTGPAFSAYQSSAQTLSGVTFTKITFTTEVFDTNNNFASSTFTPTVAGYYQVTSAIYFATLTNAQLYIYKNGTLYQASPFTSQQGAFISGLVYLNGSTDYVETYAYLVTGQSLTTGSGNTYFQAAMVRSA
jgi:hypothetical protein